MKRRRHETESPWASFADVMSGMLFVFVITTFWFAWQLSVATADQEEKAKAAEKRLEELTRAAEKARELAGEGPRTVTECLRGETSKPDARLDPTPQASEARISLYFRAQGVEWFETERATLGLTQRHAVARIRTCIEQLLERQQGEGDLRPFRLRIYLEGHTDAVPMKGAALGGESNWELSGRRAAAVLREVLVPTTNRSAVLPRQAQDDASPIRLAQARGNLELLAVGMADRQPAWGRICKSVDLDDETIANELDRPICAALSKAEDAAAESQRSILLSSADVYRWDPQCREQDIDLASLTTQELLRAWANRCVKQKSGSNKRLGLLRRVDLRFELLPRLDVESD